jgi:hypothetical protein
MEQSIRNVLTAAVHKVKSKTYAVEPADPVQSFLDDLFSELFPSSSIEQTVTIPVAAAEPAAKERKKPGPKPKVDEQGNPIVRNKKGPVHVDKLTPAEVKKLKAISADFDKKAFLAYVNGLDRETFDSKSLEDHLRTLAAPASQPEPVLREHECVEVLFHDTIYYVDPLTKRVYEPQDEVNVAVGYVGQAAFKDMPMPDTES